MSTTLQVSEGDAPVIVCQDSNEKVITMRHESEALDRNIKSLTKSFHSYCKMKGEQSCGETIALVNDHLKRRTSCRFIHKDLQVFQLL